MAVASEARGQSQGKMIIAIVLAVIAVVAVIAGVMYLIEPAKALPSILGSITHPAARADAHRSLRGEIALGAGVVLLVAAFFARRLGK